MTDAVPVTKKQKAPFVPEVVQTVPVLPDHTNFMQTAKGRRSDLDTTILKTGPMPRER